MSVTNARFTDNVAGYSGGAIESDNEINLYSSTFTGNRAEDAGGAASPSTAAKKKAATPWPRPRVRVPRAYNASEPDSEELAGLRNETAALLVEFDEELAAQLALIETRRKKLVALRALAANIEANGTAALAKLMNLERAQTLRVASTVPLNLEMVGETKERRLEDFARLSLIVDLFESLAK